MRRKTIYSLMVEAFVTSSISPESIFIFHSLLEPRRQATCDLTSSNDTLVRIYRSSGWLCLPGWLCLFWEISLFLPLFFTIMALVWFFVLFCWINYPILQIWIFFLIFPKMPPFKLWKARATKTSTKSVPQSVGLTELKKGHN